MATTTLEIPVGSGNFVKVNVDAYNNLSQQERSDFYDYKESQYKEQIQNQQRDQLREDQSDLRKKTTSTTGEKITGTLRGAGQGLTFGFGDEIEAGLKTGFGLLGDYGKTVGDIRQDIDDFRVSDPALAYGSEIAGGIAPALFTGGAGAVAQAGRMGIGALAKQGAKTGAKFGGAYGVGTAESDPGASVFEMAKDRAIGLGGGAVLGAVTGGALNPAIAGATKGIGALNQGIKKIMGGTDPNKNPALVKDVNRSIAKRLNEESSDDIARVVDDTVNPTVLADVGENTRFLAYGTQGISNPSRSGVAKQLNERNNEQSSRILDLVKRTTGISDDKLGFNFLDDLDDQVQRLAKPQYDEAYKVNIPANKFKALFGSTKVDAIVEASREGLKASRRQGYDVPDLTKIFKVNPKNGNASFDELMMKDLPTSYLHAIKKGLDKIVERNKNRNFGKLDSDGRDYAIITRELNDIIKANNPAYGKANKNFADTMKLQEAFERGQKYKTTTNRRIKKDLEAMTPGEQEAWKKGMITKLEDVAESSRESFDFLGQVGSSKKLDDIFDFLISDPKQKEAFKNVMKNERKMSDTFKLLRQNSNTGQKSEAIDEFKNMAGLTTGGGRDIINRVVGKATDKLTGGTQSKRAELIAERLFSTDKNVQKQVLKQLETTNKELAKEVQKRLDKALKLTKAGSRSLQILSEGTGSKQELLDALGVN